MNKAELIRNVSQETGETQKVVGEVLNSIINEIGDTLDACEDVAIASFGKFYTQDMPARKARNPRTGETIDVPAKTKAKFKFSKGFFE